MPMVSVIVPVYKVEQYLNRCVESILDQTYGNFELILIDDGSPDECPQMCDEWGRKDPRVKVIHQKNMGLSAARNAGLDICSGQYIVFVDSDDWISNDALEYLLRLIKDNNADFAYTPLHRTRSFEVKKDKIDGIDELLTQGDFLDRLFKIGTQENVQYVCGKIFKQNLFTNVRFPIGVIAEDVPTTFQVALESRIIVRGSRCIYKYFVNCDSITQKTFSKKRFDLLTVWAQILQIAEKNCTEKYKEAARINFIRAKFGLLCNINLEPIKKDDKTYVRLKEKELKTAVKSERKKLLKFQIPLSRKLILLGFCFAYPVTSGIMKATSAIKRMVTK